MLFQQKICKQYKEILYPFLQSLFAVNPCQHPIVILKDVPFEDLQTVVQFMYNGVVNVSSDKLTGVLKVQNSGVLIVSVNFKGPTR